MGFPHIFVECSLPSPEKLSRALSPRQILPASEALSLHGLEPLSLVCSLYYLSNNKAYLFSQLPKEHIGMVNGTSFSASVGALIAFESVGAMVLGEVSQHFNVSKAYFPCSLLGGHIKSNAKYSHLQGLHRNGYGSTSGNSSQFRILHQ